MDTRRTDPLIWLLGRWASVGLSVLIASLFTVGAQQ